MNIVEATDTLVNAIEAAGTESEKIELLNGIRSRLAEVSPMKHHPIDFVEWIPFGDVSANDYNPNSVAKPEMELLRLSVDHDGFTQPIVTFAEDGKREVVDGFHRNRVGREFPEIAERLFGYLPTVRIRSEATDRSDRIASTIRHNRARGKHQVVKMTEIVLELKRRNWSDSKISKNLGMDDDEVLRLGQIGGLADIFADREFSMAWEVEEDGLDDERVG